MKRQPLSRKNRFLLRAFLAILGSLIFNTVIIVFIRKLSIKRPPPAPNNLSVFCYGESSGSSVVGPKSAVVCAVVSETPLLKADFAETPIVALDDEVSLLAPLAGAEGGVYMECKIQAPSQTGSYLLRTKLASGLESTEATVLHVVRVSPEQLSLCCGTTALPCSEDNKVVDVNMQDLVHCTIFGKVPLSTSLVGNENVLFHHIGNVERPTVVNAVKQKDNDPFRLEFSFKVGCNPASFSVGLNVSVDDKLVDMKEPPVTVRVHEPTAGEVTLVCAGTVNSVGTVAYNETVECVITSRAAMRLEDFGENGFAASDRLRLVAPLSTDPPDKKCARKFTVSFQAPAETTEVYVRGMFADGNFFAQSSVVVQVGLVEPKPQQVELRCTGSFSEKEQVSWGETVNCEIKSAVATFNSSFAAKTVLAVPEGKGLETGFLVDTVLEKEEFLSMKLETTYKSGLVAPRRSFKVVFRAEMDTGHYLLYGVLSTGDKFAQPCQLWINRCPQDGVQFCKEEWQYSFAEDGKLVGLKRLTKFPETNKSQFLFWGDVSAVTVLDLTNTSANEEISLNGFVALKRLLLSSNDFVSLDKIVLPSLTYIDASLNKIATVSANTLNSSTKLTEIVLANNILKILPHRTFAAQTDLEVLDLSNNPLQSLPFTVFTTNKPKLRKVNLKGLQLVCQKQWLKEFANEFSQTSGKELEGNEELQNLSFCNCPASLGDSICEGWTAQRIVVEDLVPFGIEFSSESLDALVGTGLVTLDSAVFSKQNFVLLDLSNNRLCDLSAKDLAGNSQIRVLRAKGNAIENLETDFLSFSANSLTLLNLSENAMNQVAVGAFDLSSLKYLLLNNNKLRNLPADLFVKNNEELTLVVLSDNNELVFGSEDKVFAKSFPSLNTVVIQNCALTEIPDAWFSASPNMAGFDFSGNKIESIPENFLGNSATEFRAFVLEKNRLATVPTDYFSKDRFPKLALVSLNENSLVSLESGFLNSPTVTRLFLNSNQIKQIGETALNASGLLELDLSNNLLESLAPSVFATLTKLDTLF